MMKSSYLAQFPSALTRTAGIVTAIGTIAGVFWFTADAITGEWWPDGGKSIGLIGVTGVLTILVVSIAALFLRRHARQAADIEFLKIIADLRSLAEHREADAFIRDLGPHIRFCFNPVIPSACLTILKLHLVRYYIACIDALIRAGEQLSTNLTYDSNPTQNSAESHRLTAALLRDAAQSRLAEQAAASLVGNLDDHLGPVVENSFDITEAARYIFDVLNTQAAKSSNVGARQAVNTAGKGARELLARLHGVKRDLKAVAKSIRAKAAILRTEIARVCDYVPGVAPRSGLM